MQEQFNFPLYLLAIVVFTVGCAAGPAKTTVYDIDFSKTIDPAYQTLDDSTTIPLRVAIAAMTSPRRTLDYYEEVLHDLSENLNRPLRIEQRKTYAEVNRLIMDNQVDFAFICSGAYVLLRKQLPVDILAVPVIGGKTVYRAYVIAGKGIDANNLEDLRGRSFAYTDPLSNTGYAYVAERIEKMGSASSDFFNRIIFSHGHDTSIRAVNRGSVDAATIDGLIFDYLVKFDSVSVANIKVIEKSPPYGIPPIVVRSDLDSNLKRLLQDYFLSLAESPGGHALLRPLLIDRFVTGYARAYDTLPAQNIVFTSE